MGVTGGAFHWSVSPWHVAAKLVLAKMLVQTGALWSTEDWRYYERSPTILGAMTY